MKRIIVLVLLVLSFSLLMAESSKIAYIDSEKIMKLSKDTQEAQKSFETDSKKWQEQVKKIDEEVQRLESEFEARKLTLTETGKKEAADKIAAKREEGKKLVQDIFGENGLAAKRNAELLQPILKKMQGVIEKIALEDGYDVVFDASSSGILYAKPRLEITDRVLEEMNKEK